MEERSTHITVVVGASAVAEELRRLLVQRNVAHAGVATHLRGLRSSIVTGCNDLVILCIALDQATLQRHGNSLRALLADCHCFPQAVRSVGLLTEVGLTQDVASMGCDVYAHNSKEAANAVRLLARRWREQRVKAISSRRAQQRVGSERSQQDTWLWGMTRFPRELSLLTDSRFSAIADAAADDVVERRRTSATSAELGRGTHRKPEIPPSFD